MEYFKVADKYFKQINHYKYRNPPWIRLYNDYLEDYQFSKLPDQKKYHFIAILLLSTRCENKIIYDSLWITNKINASSEIDLNTLLKDGFIEKLDEEVEEINNKNKELSADDSASLSCCEHNASNVLDQSREEESREEKSREEESALPRAQILFNFKIKKFSTKITQEYYDELKTNYPRVNVLTEFGKMNQWYLDNDVAITPASFKSHVRKWMNKTQANPYKKCEECGKEILKGQPCYTCQNKQKSGNIKNITEILKEAHG